MNRETVLHVYSESSDGEDLEDKPVGVEEYLFMPPTNTYEVLQKDALGIMPLNEENEEKTPNGDLNEEDKNQ